MTADVLIVFALIVVAIVLFAWERVSFDVTAVIIMATLMLSGILTPEEGLAGLSNPATVTIGAMFVLSEGLRRTGLLSLVGNYFARLGEQNYWLALAAMMGLIGVLSAFINNTAAVAIFIPVVIGVASDLRVSASKLLMPLSFAAMFGGVCTLIGTSTNILVSSIAEKNGLAPFSMFEFIPLGIVLFGVGFAYLFFVGIRLIPDRRGSGDLTSDYEMNAYLTDVVIEPGSEYAGRSLPESPLTRDLDLDVLSVFHAETDDQASKPRNQKVSTAEQRMGQSKKEARRQEADSEGQARERKTKAGHQAEPRQKAHRQKASATTPQATASASYGKDEAEGEDGQNAKPQRGAGAVLEAGDVLRIRGSAGEIEKLVAREGVHLRPTKEWYDIDLERGPDALVEVVVAPDSPLVSETVGTVDFRERFGAIPLAVRQRGELQQNDLGHIRLSGGDAVLLMMDRERIGEISQDDSFVLSSEVGGPQHRWKRIGPAVAILAGVVGLAALGVLPIVVTAVTGCVLMVLTGCLTTQEAYEAINWKVIFLLAGVLPLGTAMDKTGAADLLSAALLGSLGDLGPTAVLSGFFFLSMMLTNVVSNQATAALLAPIAIQSAGTLGVEARPFLVAITFAASLSFMTPVGYQTNTMIYGPGQFKFTDFTKVGTPLNVLFWIIATLLIPVFWSF